MINEIGAADKISGLAAKALKLPEMKEFQTKYSNLIKAYQASPLGLMSDIQITTLKEFQEWKPHLLDNKDKVLPLIISKMLKGDIFALNIYKELSPHSIDYETLHQDKSILDELRSYGGGEDGVAIINARHWLTTQEATDIFDHFVDGRNVECEVDEMLNINNQFINCDNA